MVIPFSSCVRLLLCSVVAGLLLPALSHAGGLYLWEFATPSTGTANAGAEALGRDASTALHNPAGMTRLDEHQAMLGLAPGFTTVEFDPASGTPAGGNDGGDQGGFVPIFSGHYVHALTDRARLGLGAFSFSGAVLDPSGGWAGRNEMTEIDLLTLAVLPSLAVEITDWLSIGGGPLIVYGRLDWDLRPPLPAPPGAEANLRIDDADDVAVAGVVGLMLEPRDDLRIGLVFQDKTELELSGDLRFGVGLTPSIDVDLDLAARLTASSYWQATEELAVLFTLGWEDWSTLDTTAVRINNTGQQVRLGLQDTVKVGGGIEYRLREDLLLQTGITYDSSALRNKHRTVALPIDRQIRFGLGAIWDYDESFDIAVNFQFADLGNSKVRSSVVRGNYDRNQLFLFGVMVNWKNLPWANWGRF